MPRLAEQTSGCRLGAKLAIAFVFRNTHAGEPAGRSAVVRSHCIGRKSMAFGIDHLQPIIALIAGILILLIPRLLNFIVAVYLIVVGITGLFPNLLR
jgi:hypothetical protein